MTQFLSTLITSDIGVAAVNGVQVQVGTLVLPPGQWLVDGEGWINIISGTPALQLVGSVLSVGELGSFTEPALDEASNIITLAMSASTKATAGFCLPLNSLMVDFRNVNTTIFLGTRVDWTGTGTMVCYGQITARRPDVPMYLPA
jgi:hypothetical protein